MFFAGARGRSGIEFGSRRGRAVGTTVAVLLALAGAAILPRLPADWYLKVLVPGWMPHQLVKLIEYSNDLQIALVADRPTEPHARIALVLIRDETIADLPYVSPIDRKRLTDITEAVDRLGARVIGLDLLLDQATEPDKDRAFAASLQRRRATVVLGGADERTPLIERRRDWQTRFLTETGLPFGFFNLRYDVQEAGQGNVVRARAARHPGSTFHLAFAEALAKAAGVSSWPEARRIPWLREPRGGGDTFLTLDADSVLAADRDPDGALSRAIEAQLHNRVVLIGADVDGRDRHPTPLTRVTGEEMLGVAVHAQVLAGLLDGRALEEIGTVPAAMLAFAATLLGALAGWFAARRRFVLMALLALGTGLVGAVSAIVLWQSQAIVPLPALVAALIGAAIVARVLRSAIGS